MRNSTAIRRGVALAALLAAVAIVAILLLGIWALTGGGYFWPAWPLLGWGVPLAAGALHPRRAGCAHRRARGVPRDRMV